MDPSDLQRQRVPLARSISLKFKEFRGFITEMSANVSLGGMFVTTDDPKPPGTVFDFEMTLSDRYPLVQGIAEVVWIRVEGEDPDQPQGMGVRFLQLSSESARLVHKIVEEHVRTGGKPFDLEGERPRPAATRAAPPFTPAPEWLTRVRPAAAAPAASAAAPREAAASPPGAAAAARAEELPSLEAWHLEGGLGRAELDDLPPAAARTPAAETGEEDLLPEVASVREAMPAPEFQPPPDLDAAPETVEAPQDEVALAAGEEPAEPPIELPPAELPPAELPPPELPAGPSSRVIRWAGDLDEVARSFASPPTQPSSRPVAEPSFVRSGTEVVAPSGPQRIPWRGSTHAPRRRRGPALLAVLLLVVGGAVVLALLRPDFVEGWLSRPQAAPDERETAAAADQEAASPTPALETPPAVETAAVPETEPVAMDDGMEPPADAVERIHWQRVDGRVVVTLFGNGAFEADRYSHFRLTAPPREVVRVADLSRPYRETSMPVDDPLLARIRTGWHVRGGANELHVVLDVADAGVELVELTPSGRTLRLVLARTE